MGRDIAINQSDEKLIQKVQKGIKGSLLYCPERWNRYCNRSKPAESPCESVGETSEILRGRRCSPVYFVNPQDVADYLGTAQITMQTAFGFTYIENFLGLGTAIVSPQVDEKEPIATAKENLGGRICSDVRRCGTDIQSYRR